MYSDTNRSNNALRKRRDGACRCLALALACLPAMLLSACSSQRERAQLAPAYESEISALLERRCSQCHAASDAGTDYRLDTYLDALRCASPADDAGSDVRAGSALVHGVARSDHAGVVTASERKLLEEFVAGGAPLRHAGVHRAGVLNPRSPEWHGRLAAADHFAAITSASYAGACGRCHEGAPVRPGAVRHPAPGAPDCKSCHRAEQGVLACGTCHGDGAERAYPPRDSCWFASDGTDAHQAHVEGDVQLHAALACTTCHPAADVTFSGTHANGHVDVVFDVTLAGSEAHYDSAQKQCTVRCHDRGGARPTPRFSESTPLTCGDCHALPPADHYAGSCDTCHREVSANGMTLQAHVLHMNGRIDLGDGSGRCSACHGRDDDPAPSTGLHALHLGTQLTQGIVCADCHAVPDQVVAPGHLDIGNKTPADITFGVRASARDQQPSYQDGTCRQIACHGAGLPGNTEHALRWDAQPSGECASCHGLPPRVQHPKDTTCAGLQCHGTEVTAGTPVPGISASGRALHINGVYDTMVRN